MHLRGLNEHQVPKLRQRWLSLKQAGPYPYQGILFVCLFVLSIYFFFYKVKHYSFKKTDSSQIVLISKDVKYFLKVTLDESANKCSKLFMTGKLA